MPIEMKIERLPNSDPPQYQIIYYHRNRGDHNERFSITDSNIQNIFESYFKKSPDTMRCFVREQGIALSYSKDFTEQEKKEIHTCFSKEYDNFLKTNQENFRKEIKAFKQDRMNELKNVRTLSIIGGTSGVAIMGTMAVLGAVGLIFPPAGAVLGITLFAIGAVTLGALMFASYRLYRADHKSNTKRIEYWEKQKENLINDSSTPSSAPNPLAAPGSIPQPSTSPSVPTPSAPQASTKTPPTPSGSVLKK